FYPAIMEALFKSNAWIAVVMITDLLARKYRFNVPGTTAKSNWTRRMQRSVAQLRSSRKTQARIRVIHELLEKSGRTKCEVYPGREAFRKRPTFIRTKAMQTKTWRTPRRGLPSSKICTPCVF